MKINNILLPVNFIKEHKEAISFSTILILSCLPFIIYWLKFAPSIPIISEIVISKSIIWKLPFGISRIWDFILGPITILIISGLFDTMFDSFNPNEDFGIIITLFAIIGIIFGLVSAFQLPEEALSLLPFVFILSLVTTLGSKLAGIFCFYSWCLIVSISHGAIYALPFLLVLFFYLICYIIEQISIKNQIKNCDDCPF